MCREWGAKPKSGLAWRYLGRSHGVECWENNRGPVGPGGLAAPGEASWKRASRPCAPTAVRESTLKRFVRCPFPGPSFAVAPPPVFGARHVDTAATGALASLPETFPSRSPGLQDDGGGSRTSSWIGDPAGRVFKGCRTLPRRGIVIGGGRRGAVNGPVSDRRPRVVISDKGRSAFDIESWCRFTVCLFWNPGSPFSFMTRVRLLPPVV